MSIIITGSVAYDYLMSFPGRFSEHILPDQIHQVSLSFLVDSMRKRPGGVAPNIAYSLTLLGEHPTVMATVGPDFGDYRTWLEEKGVDTSAILEVEDEFTSSFFVTTDLDNNQIASFYIGAMGKADRLSFRNLDQIAGITDIEIACISPNAPTAMVKYAQECQDLGIPYIYDPSQQIVRLTSDELIEGTDGARMLIVNEYEFGMLRNKTGLTTDKLLALPEITIVTRGKDGATIYAEDQTLTIPAVAPEPMVEPTGVGDAYRAGIIKGMLRGYSWDMAGRIAALAATYVLEQHGTQDHSYTLDEFVTRFRRVFGDIPEVEEMLS